MWIITRDGHLVNTDKVVEITLKGRNGYFGIFANDGRNDLTISDYCYYQDVQPDMVRIITALKDGGKVCNLGPKSMPEPLGPVDLERSVPAAGGDEDAGQ